MGEPTKVNEPVVPAPVAPVAPVAPAPAAVPVGVHGIRVGLTDDALADLEGRIEKRISAALKPKPAPAPAPPVVDPAVPPAPKPKKGFDWSRLFLFGGRRGG